MLGADNSEVAPVQGGHLGQIQALRYRDDRGIDGPEGQSAYVRTS